MYMCTYMYIGSSDSGLFTCLSAKDPEWRVSCLALRKKYFNVKNFLKVNWKFLVEQSSTNVCTHHPSRTLLYVQTLHILSIVSFVSMLPYSISFASCAQPQSKRLLLFFFILQTRHAISCAVNFYTAGVVTRDGRIGSCCSFIYKHTTSVVEHVSATCT
jgi:hypothetical protein